MARAQGILTEVGTNELEVVEFLVDGRPFAINVAKVREIIRYQTPMPLPESPPHVAGVFRNREDVLPLVDLGRWLRAASDADPATAKIIVAEFNGLKVGLLVHGVRRIHRVSWADLESPDPGSLMETPYTLGFLRLGEGAEGERIVFMLDFERIVAELGGRGEDSPATPGRETGDRLGKVILVAEDSGLIRKNIRQRLEAVGYTVTDAVNGEQAWEALDGGARVALLVSDIEMPRMDGHHLTRRVKGDPRFAGLPVVLYSSMIHEEMRQKGESLGADAQVCKPDMGLLLETVDRLVLGGAR